MSNKDKGEEMSNEIFNWTTLACAIITIAFNYIAERRRNRNDKVWKEKIEKKEKESELKIDRMNCSNDFSKVMIKKEMFVEVLSEAEDLDDIDKKNMSEDQIRVIQRSNAKIIRRIFNNAVSFYNELDEFCSKVIEGTYIAEDYIRKDVSVSVLDFAKMQPQYYNSIKNLYRVYKVPGFTPFKRHRLKNIDKFIDRYLHHHKGILDNAWTDYGF